MKIKPCKRCKKPFRPVNEQGRYCGDACRQAASRERKTCPNCGHYLIGKPKFKRTPAEPA